MCDNKSRRGEFVQWVLRDERGRVVRPGQGGRGRCEKVKKLEEKGDWYEPHI